MNQSIRKKFKDKSIEFSKDDWKRYDRFWDEIDRLHSLAKILVSKQLEQEHLMYDEKLLQVLEMALQSNNNEIETALEAKNKVVHSLSQYKKTSQYKTMLALALFFHNERINLLSQVSSRLKTNIFKVKRHLGINIVNSKQDSIDDKIQEAKLVKIESFFNTKSTTRKIMVKCLLHNDNTPSCSIDTEKNLYYCFGCGKGGDVINFVQEWKNCSFIEAINFLTS